MDKFEEDIWWRGQAKSTWDLRPRIYDPGEYKSEISYINLFKSKAISRRSNCPALDDYPSWLFLAQHHRLQTRLLDWTESMLIATFFAIWEDEYLSNTGALWALDPGSLNENQFGKNAIHLPTNPSIIPLFDQAFVEPLPEEEKVEKIAAIRPHEVDIQMMVQMSVFTIHGTSKPLNKLKDNEKFLMKFLIPANAKRKIRRLLEDLGIRESNLFPDLGHLSKEIMSYEFGRRSKKLPA
jgi:hypothetical protein